MESNAQTFTIAGERLNSVIKRVYFWMCGGLTVTAVVALLCMSTPNAIEFIFANKTLFFLLAIIEIGIVLYLSARILTLSYGSAATLFLIYSALNGATLAPLLLIYTGASVVSTFFVAAGTFGALSIWASTTKRDISGLGQYLIFGLFGIIIASVINIFLGSDGLDFLVAIAGVVIFMGLTAFDTQQIKNWSESIESNSNSELISKMSLLGALRLYLDFINMFIFLLHIFGRRR